jgi:NAD(P)H-flavin reductase
MCKKRSVTEHTEETDEDPPEGTPLKIRVALPRPMHVKAGQYVNLWIPSASFSSWLQCHPFMVTSWSPGKQDVLELFVQTRRGLTEKLRARAALEGMATFTTFVSGPYGRSEPVGEYESVLVVASGFGIAGVVPYIKRLLYGYNTSSARVRRIHLVWQVQTKGK